MFCDDLGRDRRDCRHDAAGVGEQVPQPDATQAAAAELGNEFAHRHVEVQLTLFDPREHDGVGELLADRERDEHVFLSHRPAAFAIGVTVHVAVDRLAMTTDGEGGAVVAPGLDVGVDARWQAGESAGVEAEIGGSGHGVTSQAGMGAF